ncbi:hypothetical protein SmJEL517_g04224 [Synchytrium microbalum]|uniref:Uncharacterized protein n=1 Tax=Synchytrium microbalum TaxID=1806994 RepID=A0A507C000_9FUNG|nr:uncharacterized protein SmJEL517_g04224 [Synchytrium microbalum]TPX32688.1 hypothetical protein SmJEL517_g04224 [Synchytrium microbalum]
MASSAAIPTIARPKLVVVGDGACGKTCLLIVFSQGVFPEEYAPTVFENYVKEGFRIDGKPMDVALWDTAGQEDYDRLRTLSYPGSNIVLICFSVDEPVSLSSIPTKWVPEVRHYCPGLPYVLVACKTDLRNNTETITRLKGRGLSPITADQARTCWGVDNGYDVARKVGAAGYLECSARLNVGVDQVFEQSVKTALLAAKSQASRSVKRTSSGGKAGAKRSRDCIII